MGFELPVLLTTAPSLQPYLFVFNVLLECLFRIVAGCWLNNQPLSVYPWMPCGRCWQSRKPHGFGYLEVKRFACREEACGPCGGSGSSPSSVPQ